jgi:hypothetical protein
MIIFFLPLAMILVLYIIDVGIAREPRDRKKNQLTLPLEPSPADLQPRDAAHRSTASS